MRSNMVCEYKINQMWKHYSFSILSICHSFTISNIKITRRSLMWTTATTIAKPATQKTENEDTICLGFTGDVMLGRGVDAILPNHVDGTLYESYMKHATGYVDLAIRQNGPLPSDELKERGNAYIWGDLIETFNTIPDMMIINLETSLTTSDDYAHGKGINYRAHPLNVESLKFLGSNTLVTLANNHVLDWGESGLKETLQTLDKAHVKHAGAGESIYEATYPAMIEIKSRKVAVIAVGLPSAGVPMQWSASTRKSGVFVKEYESISNAKDIMNVFNGGVDDEAIKIVSVHMGPNWNLRVPDDWRRFAHTLIDDGADIVVAHSSHHVKGIEVYKNKMISYGLGDFLNDYEGITGQGYEAYRQDLTCLYLPKVTSNGTLKSIDIIPCQIKHLRVQRATNQEDIAWICKALSREGKALGTTCETVTDSKGNTNLHIIWNSQD